MACEFLINKGHKILEKNFRCKTGEIDIITLKDKCIHFVEVKYRNDSQYGHSKEAISFAKWNKIYKTSQYYLKTHHMRFDTDCSFDVIAIQNIDIEYIENCYGVM